MEISSFDHLFKLLFHFLAVILATICLFISFEFNAENANRIRVVLMKSNLFALDSELDFVGIDIQCRSRMPNFLKKRLFISSNMRR